MLIISPCVNAVDVNRFLKVFQMAKRSDFFKKNKKKNKKKPVCCCYFDGGHIWY